jgi:hypothetical protein
MQIPARGRDIAVAKRRLDFGQAGAAINGVTGVSVSKLVRRHISIMPAHRGQSSDRVRKRTLRRPRHQQAMDLASTPVQRIKRIDRFARAAAHLWIAGTNQQVIPIETFV